MELYNGIIKQTEELLAGSSGITWPYAAGGAWPDAGKNELIMQRESALELGGSGHSAVTYSCVTTDSALLTRDEVVLYGPDIGKLKADSHYARIVFITVQDIGQADDAFDAIRRLDFVRYHIFPRGFMMRALPDDCREQVRIGRAYPFVPWGSASSKSTGRIPPSKTSGSYLSQIPKRPTALC